MEIESFESVDVAKLLNDWFVSIKVNSIRLIFVSFLSSVLSLFVKFPIYNYYILDAILTNQSNRWIGRNVQMLTR